MSIYRLRVGWRSWRDITVSDLGLMMARETIRTTDKKIRKMIRTTTHGQGKFSQVNLIVFFNSSGIDEAGKIRISYKIFQSDSRVTHVLK